MVIFLFFSLFICVCVYVFLSLSLSLSVYVCVVCVCVCVCVCFFSPLANLPNLAIISTELFLEENIYDNEQMILTEMESILSRKLQKCISLSDYNHYEKKSLIPAKHLLVTKSDEEITKWFFAKKNFKKILITNSDITLPFPY